MIRIGIDLGGTKTEIVALDDMGAELLRFRTATPEPYEQRVQNICDMVFKAESDLGCKGTVGLGIPGSISPHTGLIRNANSVVLNGHPLDKDIMQILSRDIRVENDANCFAVSEACDGAAAGYPIVFAVIIGTGCGGGIVVNGKPIKGANGIGGEWGHTCLPRMTEAEWPGKVCYCGQRGCKEHFLSGTGFCDDYEKASGTRLKGDEITALARQGDTTASQTLDRYIDRLAKSLADIADILDPDIIVLGGGMSNVDELYERVQPLMSSYSFSDGIDTPIVKAKHGDSSGVRGAAWLWSVEEAKQFASKAA